MKKFPITKKKKLRYNPRCIFLNFVDRRKEILKAIVEIFVRTASPVGSKFLKEEAQFDLSSATLRNEMAALEKEGLLVQIHTSGGRIPTSQGYRIFVNELTIPNDFRSQILQKFHDEEKRYFEEKKADQVVFDIVSILTRVTPNIVFATIPSARQTFFLGFSRMLSQPEFYDFSDTSGIFRVLEENFYDILQSLHIGNEIEVFIGQENILPEMSSCSLIVSNFQTMNSTGYFGILGPIRMDYAQNIVILEAAKKLFHS